jgi:hypothetical protein
MEYFIVIAFGNMGLCWLKEKDIRNVSAQGDK